VSSIPAGRRFREAWIAGVTAHFPGDPKSGYITPWDDTPDWERACAAAVEHQVLDFISVTAGATTKLTREQKGRFVALCWIGQIHCRHLALRGCDRIDQQLARRRGKGQPFQVGHTGHPAAAARFTGVRVGVRG
jgi:hypothetical protein